MSSDIAAGHPGVYQYVTQPVSGHVVGGNLTVFSDSWYSYAQISDEALFAWRDQLQSRNHKSIENLKTSPIVHVIWQMLFIPVLMSCYSLASLFKLVSGDWLAYMPIPLIGMVGYLHFATKPYAYHQTLDITIRNESGRELLKVDMELRARGLL